MTSEKGAHHHRVKVMKEIQKLRSARQRLPSCADITLGVAVAMSTLSLLSANVVRIVAAHAHTSGVVSRSTCKTRYGTLQAR